MEALSAIRSELKEVLHKLSVIDHIIEFDLVYQTDLTTNEENCYGNLWGSLAETKAKVESFESEVSEAN